MKIVNAGYEIINEPSITKKIERIARVCYKSEDKIGEGTDIKMINSLIQRSHFAMLEHASIVLKVSGTVYAYFHSVIDVLQTYLYRSKEYGLTSTRSYLRLSSDKVSKDNSGIFYVSGNIRAWFETFAIASQMNLLDKQIFDCINKISGGLFREMNCSDLQTPITDCIIEQITDFSTMSKEARLIHEDISVLFTSDLLIQRELVRHREASFAGESTRYCNYSLDKFGNEITVIKPCFLEEDTEAYGEWKNGCEEAEKYYFSLLNQGLTPQQARDVLPVATKCDTVVTANLREWKHIFNLRACDSTGPAHPKMHEIMIPLFKDLRAEKYNFAFGDMYASDEVHP